MCFCYVQEGHQPQSVAVMDCMLTVFLPRAQEQSGLVGICQGQSNV